MDTTDWECETSLGRTAIREMTDQYGSKAHVWYMRLELPKLKVQKINKSKKLHDQNASNTSNVSEADAQMS